MHPLNNLSNQPSCTPTFKRTTPANKSALHKLIEKTGSLENKLENDVSIDLTDRAQGDKILARAQDILSNNNRTAKLSYWPETLASKLAESKKYVQELEKKTHLTVIIPVYNELVRMQTKEQHKNGEDFVREKIRQLDWFKDCKNFSWDMMIVDDGCPYNSGKAAQEIVSELSSNPASIGRFLSITYKRASIIIVCNLPAQP